MITNAQAPSSRKSRAFNWPCNFAIFSRRTSIWACASTAGTASSFWLRQISFNSWSFMNGLLLLHQDRKLFLRAVQGHAHVVRAQAQRVCYFLIAEILKEEDD